MKICAVCKKEMYCKKNGMIIRYGATHCYAGDKYRCRECGAEVIICNDNFFQSETEPSTELLVQMD